MAIVNKYVDVNLGAVPPKLGSNALVLGGEARTAVQSFVVGSTDAAGSIYRIFKGLSPDIIVTSLEMLNDALTGATSVQVGAYESLDYDNIGAAISVSAFGTNLNISAGNPITGATFNLMPGVSIANRAVPAWTLFGDLQFPAKHPQWDLCLTMTAMTTGATGNVWVKMSYVQL